MRSQKLSIRQTSDDLSTTALCSANFNEKVTDVPHDAALATYVTGHMKRLNRNSRGTLRTRADKQIPRVDSHPGSPGIHTSDLLPDASGSSLLRRRESSRLLAGPSIFRSIWRSGSKGT